MSSLCLPDRRARWNKDGTKATGGVCVRTGSLCYTSKNGESVIVFCPFATQRDALARLMFEPLPEGDIDECQSQPECIMLIQARVWCARLEMSAHSCEGCITWAEFTSWTSASRYPQVTPVWEEVMGSLLAVFTWRRWPQTSMDRTGWTWTT